MTTIIYVATPSSRQIQVLKISKNFNLKIIQILNTDGEVQPISIFKNRLYAGMRFKHCIITYNIKKDGTLEKIGESLIPGSPNYLSLDKKNNFLFCASYGMGCFSVSRINELGIPTNPIQIIKNIDGCHYCNTDSDNTTLFVTSLKKNCIYLYNLTENGLLLKNTPYKLNTLPGSGPRHMDFHPNKKYAYSINELNSTIDVWKLKNNKKPIELVQNISMLPKQYDYKPWASDIHVNPSGSYVYACDRTASIISMFSIDKNNNKLKKIGFFPTEKQPRSFAISPNGQYLVVAGEISNSITLYTISDRICNLQEKKKIKIKTRPIWVCMHQL